MVVAKNDLGTAQEVFRQQVITSVAQLEDAYYNLAAFQLNVQVAQESLAAVKELLNQTKKEEEIGVLSRVDVETVESQAAARRTGDDSRISRPTCSSRKRRSSS